MTALRNNPEEDKVAQQRIHSGKEPVRMFKSDFLEFFTHIHPAIVFAIWFPIIVFLLLYSIFTSDQTSGYVFIPVSFIIGLFLWTLMEYSLHRFVFHFKTKTKRQERISFFIHGVHHVQPMLKSRLVMPPPMSLLIGAISYGVFTLILGLLFGKWHWIYPLFAGLVSGYLSYDMIHYSTHHFRLQSKAFKFIRKHHMQHHVTPDLRFGLSSPLWDYVFRTMPKT